MADVNDAVAFVYLPFTYCTSLGQLVQRLPRHAGKTGSRRYAEAVARSEDLKQFIATTTPMFDDPPAASKEAFQAVAAILAAGRDKDANIARFAGYLGWTDAEVAALATEAASWGLTPPPMLRSLVAAGLEQQVEAYALFLVHVTRIACLQFAPGDPAAAASASAIAATVTRYAPISNTRLEPAAEQPEQPEQPEKPSSAQSVEEVGKALDDLEKLVGLEAVKRQINEQVQLIRIAQMRTEAGLKNPTVSRHLVFVGNPGTGKTTVARIVGRIYAALGVVPDGHLVETDASGLIAGYVGQTAIKTAEQISRAVGGILFIDEAYGLSRNDFGLEAVDTLVKAMEDHRADLVVIVAGYPQNMQTFLESNPGLESRFPITIEFDDYSIDQLIEILARIAGENDYVLAEPGDPRLRTAIESMMGEEGFGNARAMRNLFEAAVRRHAWRLKDTTDVSVDQMTTLTVDDVLGQ